MEKYHTSCIEEFSKVKTSRSPLHQLINVKRACHTTSITRKIRLSNIVVTPVMSVLMQKPILIVLGKLGLSMIRKWLIIQKILKKRCMLQTYRKSFCFQRWQFKQHFFVSRLVTFNETFACLNDDNEPDHVILWHEAISGWSASDCKSIVSSPLATLHDLSYRYRNYVLT